MENSLNSLFDDDDFVKGRKEIMRFLGVKSWRTVRRWKKQYLRKLVFTLPNGRPVIMKSEIKAWFFRFNELVKEREEEDSK